MNSIAVRKWSNVTVHLTRKTGPVSKKTSCAITARDDFVVLELGGDEPSLMVRKSDCEGPPVKYRLPQSGQVGAKFALKQTPYTTISGIGVMIADEKELCEFLKVVRYPWRDEIIASQVEQPQVAPQTTPVISSSAISKMAATVAAVAAATPHPTPPPPTAVASKAAVAAPAVALSPAPTRHAEVRKIEMVKYGGIDLRTFSVITVSVRALKKRLQLVFDGTVIDTLETDHFRVHKELLGEIFLERITFNPLVHNCHYSLKAHLSRNRELYAALDFAFGGDLVLQKRPIRAESRIEEMKEERRMKNSLPSLGTGATAATAAVLAAGRMDTAPSLASAAAAPARQILNSAPNKITRKLIDGRMLKVAKAAGEAKAAAARATTRAAPYGRFAAAATPPLSHRPAPAAAAVISTAPSTPSSSRPVDRQFFFVRDPSMKVEGGSEINGGSASTSTRVTAASKSTSSPDVKRARMEGGGRSHADDTVAQSIHSYRLITNHFDSMAAKMMRLDRGPREDLMSLIGSIVDDTVGAAELQ